MSNNDIQREIIDAQLPIGTKLTITRFRDEKTYEIVGFLREKEGFGRIYEAYELKSNWSGVKGKKQEVGYPYPTTKTNGRYWASLPKEGAALISQSEIDSENRRNSQSEAVLSWQGVKPVYLMTKEEYSKEVTPKIKSFNKFIQANKDLFKRQGIYSFQGFDYVDFKTFEENHKPRKLIPSSSIFSTAEQDWIGYGYNESEVPKQATPKQIAELNDFLAYFKTVFPDISKIEGDETGNNKRSIRRAIDDGTYENLLREGKINFTFLKSVFNSVGVNVPAKLEKVEKEVEELGITSVVKEKNINNAAEFTSKLKVFFADAMEYYKKGFYKKYIDALNKVNYFYEENKDKQFKSFLEYKKSYFIFNNIEFTEVIRNNRIDGYNSRNNDLDLVMELNRSIRDSDYLAKNGAIKLVPKFSQVLDGLADKYSNNLFETFAERILGSIAPLNNLSKEFPNLKYAYIRSLSLNGFIGELDLVYPNGFVLSIETDAILAGGYNIQVLHIRGIIKFKNKGKFMPIKSILESYSEYDPKVDLSKQTFIAKNSNQKFENGGEIPTSENKKELKKMEDTKIAYLTTIEYEDNGKTVTWGTKNNRGRETVIGKSNEDLKEEIKYLKEMIIIGEIELKKAKEVYESVKHLGSPKMYKQVADALSFLKMTERTLYINKEILLPFFERNLSVINNKMENSKIKVGDKVQLNETYFGTAIDTEGEVLKIRTIDGEPHAEIYLGDNKSGQKLKATIPFSYLSVINNKMENKKETYKIDGVTVELMSDENPDLGSQYTFNVNEVYPKFYHRLVGTVEKSPYDNFYATYMNEMYDSEEEKYFDTFEQAESWVFSKIKKDKTEYELMDAKNKYIIAYTDASESYDGFGTKTIEVTKYKNKRGENVRKIKVEEPNLDWQTSRYSSGNRSFMTEEEFNKYKDTLYTMEVEMEEKEQLIWFTDEALEFVPEHQLPVIKGAKREYQDAIYRINKAVKDMPTTYSTEGIEDKKVYLHYFSPSADWHIVEKDMSASVDGHLQDFGYANLGYGAELGYISIDELKSIKEVNLDLYFEPVRWSSLSGESINTDINAYKNPYELNRAIEKLIDSRGDERNAYDSKDIEFISYYSGYGGLEKFGSFADDELKRLKYEFFTPDEVCKKMWALAYKYGYGTVGDSSVFEPSVGTGNFLKYAPKNVIIGANEINKYSAIICQILHPNVDLNLISFERNFIKNNLSIKAKTDSLKKYSLVIGNPPYGSLGGLYITRGEDSYSDASNWTEYFIFRGLDLLHKDGLLIFVVGAEQYNGGTMFLDSKKSKIKSKIAEKADLVDAYRLPINIFERTGVSSEIVIFKKK
jgi:hypothetical protein